MSDNGFVFIVARPHGEAPEWVRDAWIGVTMPLSAKDPVSTWGVGVLTGPTSIIGQCLARLRGRTIALEGYLVEASAAVTALEPHDATAAAWWRSNAPELLAKRRFLLFDLASGRKTDPTA